MKFQFDLTDFMLGLNVMNFEDGIIVKVGFGFLSLNLFIDKI